LIFIKNDATWFAQFKTLPSDFSSRYGAESRFENTLGYNMDNRWFTPSNPLQLYGDIAERQTEDLMLGQTPDWAVNLSPPAGLTLRTTPKKAGSDLYGEMDEIMIHIKRQEALAQLTGLSL
jgi:hypothetical protein